MINVHLNGDIIQCPDISAIHLRANQVRYEHHICRFNIIESDCSQWQKNCMINKVHQDHCNLDKEYTEQKFKDGISWKQYECNRMQQNYLNAIKPKKFKIDNTVYRKLASTAHYLVKESTSKILFLSLTFPKFKRKVTDNEINNYFSLFVENLRSNYNCGGYVAVREFGKKAHRIHFHLLLSIPFIPFPVLNDIWCNTISDICYSSKNAITSNPKTRFINDPIRAMKYVCKYFAKCKNQYSDTRLYFISNNILQKPKNMTSSSEYGFLDAFKFDYQKQTSDYTTCFRITDTKEFDRFCNEFLYPFFELSVKKQEELYTFRYNSS